MFQERLQIIAILSASCDNRHGLGMSGINVRVGTRDKQRRKPFFMLFGFYVVRAAILQYVVLLTGQAFTS